MGYCTTSDVTNRYGAEKITRLTGVASGTTPDATRMTAAIQAATDLINLKISAVVVIPLETVPDTIKQLAVSATYHFLASGSELGLSENDLKEYDNLIDLLNDIRDGKTNPFSSNPTIASGPSADFKHRTRLFVREA